MCFPEGHGLDVDDCSVDVSEENVILLLRKDLPETHSPDATPDCQWDKFSVGLNSAQTTVSPKDIVLCSSDINFTVHNSYCLYRRNCF